MPNTDLIIITIIVISILGILLLLLLITMILPEIVFFDTDISWYPPMYAVGELKDCGKFCMVTSHWTASMMPSVTNKLLYNIIF